MFKLLASSGANIRAIVGLLLPRFQSVLPFFFSFFFVSSLPFIHFFIENSANNPREPIEQRFFSTVLLNAISKT